MSVQVSEDLTHASASWVRKRKRNNSSVSLPDGTIPPASTPTASPQQITGRLRPSTPPVHQRHVATDTSPTISPCSSSLPTNIPPSPVAVRSLGADLSPTGSQSPRAVVARRLSTLDLSKNNDEPTVDDSAVSTPSQDHRVSIPESIATLPSVPNVDAINQPVRPPLQHASSSNQRPKKRVPPPRGIKSPPPKGHKPSESSNVDLQDPTPTSSTGTISSTTTNDQIENAPSLTWQDSEITGHLMQDPEDDGYGINGIGFRPTPAIASQRSQRRRQQLTAWRTREEREERERRAEKRRQGRALYGREASEVIMPVPKFNLGMLAERMDKKAVRFAV